MIVFYRFFRVFFFSLVFGFLILVFFFSNHPFPFLEDQKYFSSVLSESKKIHHLIFKDPIQEKTHQQFQNFYSKVQAFLKERTDAVRLVSQDSRFREQLFLYYLKEDFFDFDFVVHRYFKKFPDFQDFMILDSQKKLIYKYGNRLFRIRFFELEGEIDFRFEDGFYVFYQNIEDEILNQKVQLAVYFDRSEWIRLFRSYSGEVFCYLDQTLIRSSNMNLSLFRLYKSDILKKKEIYAGFKLIRVFPLKIGNKVFGYAGMVFPYRRIYYFIKTGGKILLLLFFLLLVFLVDHRIFYHLKKLEIRRKEGKSFEQEKVIEKKLENELDRSSLDWVDSYLKKESEEKE